MRGQNRSNNRLSGVTVTYEDKHGRRIRIYGFMSALKDSETLQQGIEDLVKGTLKCVLLKNIHASNIACHFAGQSVCVKREFNHQETCALSRGNVQGENLTRHLLFKLIKYTSSIGQPTEGWNKPPAENSVTCADDVVRLHQQQLITNFTFENYETIYRSLFPIVERLTNEEMDTEISILNTRLLYHLLTNCTDEEFQALLVCLLLAKDGFISKQNVDSLIVLLNDVRISLSLWIINSDGVNPKQFANEHTKHFVSYYDEKIYFASENAMDSAFLLMIDLINKEDFPIDIRSVNHKFLMRYCRTAGYRKKPGELCFALKSQETNLFISRLGREIIEHPTIQDTATHRFVCQKYNIPREVSKRGHEEIVMFVKHLQDGKQHFFHAQGMIVGCAGTGKTSLLNRIQRKPNAGNHATRQTRAVEVYEHMFSIDNGRLNVRKLIESMIDLGINNTSARRSSEQTISMLDFADHSGHYACHQIYFHRRSFFILVMDLTKSLDDTVDDSGNKGTIFEHWTYKEFFLFWMKSIHTYSNEHAPVILVWTHADKMENGEKEISKSYRRISETLSHENPDLLQHITKSRCFWIGFPRKRRLFKDIDPYRESVEEIKKCIIETSKQLDHWGMEIPTIWAVVERNIQEARSSKMILYVEDLWKSNERLYETFRLKEQSELIKILTFFHEVGKILYFPETELKEFLILDIQWFVDAFKYIITDIKHASLDQENEIISNKDYKTFIESGELSDCLLKKLWDSCREKGFYRFRSELVLYMERLGLLTTMTVFRNKFRSSYKVLKCWYVPCMNRKTFDCEDFNTYEAKSSILCFEFRFLPDIVFYKLISSCMEKDWNILQESTKKSLYQKVAVFYCSGCFVFVGLCRNSIEVQIRNLDQHASRKQRSDIRAELECRLKEIAENFHENLNFEIGYKCDRTKFCDPGIANVIRDGKERQYMLCTLCPVTKKHCIYSCELTWKSEPEFPRYSPISNFGIGRVNTGLEANRIDPRDCELMLDMVASKIPCDIELIARSLHLNQYDVDQIMRDNRYSIQEACFQILYHWRNKHRGNMNTLRIALSDNGRQDVAENIEEFSRVRYKYPRVIEPELDISTDDISIVSEEIGRKYVRLARFLRLPQRKIEQIRVDHGDNVTMCIVKTLDTIRNVKRQELCNSLVYTSRVDIIEELMHSWTRKLALNANNFFDA